MRAKEIIEENYQQSLESDLNNLLVRAKGSGTTDIDTGTLVQQLSKMGYAVDVNNIMTLLSYNPMVMNATPQNVQLSGPDTGTMGGGSSTQDSATQVRDMAAKATNIK